MAAENQLIDAGVQAGLIDPITLPELKSTARRSGLDLVQLICRIGRYPAGALYRALAERYQLPFYDRGQITVDPGLLKSLKAEILLRRLFMPVRVDGQPVLLVTDPEDRSAADTLQRSSGMQFSMAMAEPMLVENCLRQHFKVYQTGQDAIGIFDDIMKEAYIRKATDLHFEQLEEGMQLRMRVDGKMQAYERPIGNQLAEALISRIKVLAGLDIAEQNMAQDGGFSYQIADWWEVDAIEMRVATIPTRWGERATMRILGQDTADLSLAQLGMPDNILQRVRKAIVRPHGIMLVTGPTGSGKSTTLYAALRELDADKLNILTVEDPIEQVVEGISQVQVGEKVNFAQALRSFLRHDPDVMLVGEIRDKETAETAVRASMTGHMVLSTLHTNSAVSTVSRLVDIGCPRYLIASTLVGVLAQRLLRCLCEGCREARQTTEMEMKLLRLEQPETIYSACGCALCMGTGYRGRVGVYETLWINDELENLIHEGADDEVIARAADQAGLLDTLWQDASTKILSGVTSIEEAMHLYKASH